MSIREFEVPVLIVGGGGCGLSMSIFLSDLGIDHLLIERHPSTSNLPKAHYINQRTMEILRQHGVASSIYQVGTPTEHMGKVVFCSSLGGDGRLDRRHIYALSAFGGGKLRERYQQDGPCMPTNYPQMRLEPLLRSHAEQRNPDRVLFGHELISFEQDDHGVVAIVREVATGVETPIRALYMVAADGGKTVGPHLGVKRLFLIQSAFRLSASWPEWMSDRKM